MQPTRFLGCQCAAYDANRNIEFEALPCPSTDMCKRSSTESLTSSCFVQTDRVVVSSYPTQHALLDAHFRTLDSLDVLLCDDVALRQCVANSEHVIRQLECAISASTRHRNRFASIDAPRCTISINCNESRIMCGAPVPTPRVTRLKPSRFYDSKRHVTR